MDMISLKATARDASKKPGQMRRGGQVPCVVYGTVDQNMHLQCEEMALHKAFIQAGESTLISLEVDGKSVPVLFKDISFDTVTDREIHADFYAVNMKEEIETLVPIHFEGDAPAVKELSGIFVVTHDTVRVKCLPSDLPHSLTVKISSLAAFHDSVSIKDIELPKGVKILDDADTVLATIQEPRAEEVIATVAVAPTEGAAVTAEGAAPAEGAPAGDAKAAPAKEEKKK